jgi:hypothetical protein
MTTLTTSFHWLELLASVVKQEKEVKSTNIGEEEVKPFLFADDTMLCREKSYKYTKRWVILHVYW